MTREDKMHSEINQKIEESQRGLARLQKIDSVHVLSYPLRHIGEELGIGHLRILFKNAILN